MIGIRYIRTKKLLILLELIIMLFMVTACLVKESVTPLTEARTAVPVGTSREEAIRILSEKAWLYQDCTILEGITDLFFFGSHTHQRAYIVIVRYDGENKEQFIVKDISSLESGWWQGSYSYCIDESKFDKN
jgi:hypothetical protein